MSVGQTSTSVFNNGGAILKNATKMDGECVLLTVDGTEAFELIVQSAAVNITRQPNMLWEIGSNNFYILDARPSGSATLTNVVGPTQDSLSCMLSLANVCKSHKVGLEWNGPGCGCRSENLSFANGAEGKLELVGAALVHVGLTANSGSTTVSGNWGLMFADVNKQDIADCQRVSQ